MSTRFGHLAIRTMIMKTQQQTNTGLDDPISPASLMRSDCAQQNPTTQTVFEISPLAKPNSGSLPLPIRIKHDGWWLEG